MSVIAQAEDAIIAAARTLLQGRVKTVDSVPSNFDPDEMGDRLRNAPGVYVGFLGGQLAPSETETILRAKFAVYAVARNAAGERQRRRGDATAIGAYEMIEVLCPALNKLTLTVPGESEDDPPAAIDGAGSLSLEEVMNLYSEQFDKMGVGVYAAMFTVDITLAPDVSGLLHPFETFAAQYVLPPQPLPQSPLPADSDDVAAGDQVTLPQ